MPDLGELLINIRINSSAALNSLKTMKTELNDTANKANIMQQALNRTGKATNDVGKNYGNLNTSLALTTSLQQKAVTSFKDSASYIDKVTTIYEKFYNSMDKAFETLRDKGESFKMGEVFDDEGVKVAREAVRQVRDSIDLSTTSIGYNSQAIKQNNEAIERNNKVLKQNEQGHGKNKKAVMDNAAAYRTLAMYSAAAFAGITVAVKKGIDAFNQYNNALVGLRSITQGTGNSFNEAQKFIEEYTQDGLIPAANAASALKNLLSRGYNMEQAVNVLSRLKDAAAFGRQGSLSLGDAVSSATEGLKNENSVLVKVNCPSRKRFLVA